MPRSSLPRPARARHPRVRRGWKRPFGVVEGGLLEQLAHVDVPARDGRRLGIPAGRLALRRVWPHDDGRAALEYATADGRRVPAQWRADAGELRRVARETAERSPAGGAAIARPVLLQAGGADRRLAALSALARRPGARLVSHRPERRGVVRLADGRYAKVVPPARAGATYRTAMLATTLGGGELRAPAPLALDLRRAVVVLAELRGDSLHRLLGGEGAGAASPGCAVALSCAAGHAMRALHSRPLPTGLPVHGPAAEVAVLRTWARRVAPFEPVLAAAVVGRVGAVERALVGGRPGPLVPVHRDLHDKQVLLCADGAAGIVDFDLLSAGEAALDVANLLVHMELRALQRDCSPDRARAVQQELLAAYDPPACVERRLAAYAAATRLRLACVYALRPPWRALVEPLLERALEPGGRP